MEKESYSIDDILSEVKKRREENENELKASAQDKPKTDDEELTFEINEKEPSPKPQEDVVIEIPVEEKAEVKAPEEPTIVIEKEIEAPAESVSEIVIEDEPEEDDIVSDNQDQIIIDSDDDEDDDDGEMVDLLSLVNEEIEQPAVTEEKPEREKFFKTKKGKITISTIVILVVLIIAAIIFAVLYANDALNRVTNDNEPYEKVTYYEGMDFLQEDFPNIEEVSAAEVASYKEYLKEWYKNGDPVSSTHVLNVLLIGQDTREEKISNASRADSAIIASINIDTQKITLTSVLRDMFIYYEIDGEGRYGKINESAANGGIKTYINTVERYFKVSIDNYVIVNFASFPKIVDSMGGVDIAITAAEVREVNNHQKRYAKATLPEAVLGEDGKYQKVKLDGKQALAYSRIRYIDSDNARADRQKTVLLELFKKFKGTGTIDTVKVVNSLIDFVSTGYSKKDIISIGNTALKDGWLNYEIITDTVPDMENAKGGSKFAIAPKNWIWKVDFPKDAYELQNDIYGKSNITLNDNRANYVMIDY